MVYGGGKKRSMRKRTYGRRTRPKSSKKGLTKTEKTQTRKIAKSVVNSLAESKYFNVSREIGEMTFNSAWWASASSQSEIAVLGFTTGFEKAVDAAGSTQSYKYGANPANGNAMNMESLELNRLFDTDQGQPFAQYAIEGTTCRPAYAESHWLLNRLQGQQGNLFGDLPNTCNYKIRMIRCKPRPIKGSFNSVRPENDLFLDQSNLEFGINSISSGQRVFNPFEFSLAKANSRKYQILEDTTFVMGPAGSYTPDNISTIPPETSSCKVLKRTHNIGKELFYQKPNDATSSQNQYPQDGFHQEFILFHVWATGNPQTVATGRTTPELLRLSCRPVSTFKDI